jgi:hypothetical protein
MPHPVFMAFFMNHLDREDQSAVRRWSMKFAVVCGVLALLLLGAVAAGVDLADPQVEAMRRLSGRPWSVPHAQAGDPDLAFHRIMMRAPNPRPRHSD